MVPFSPDLLRVNMLTLLVPISQNGQGLHIEINGNTDLKSFWKKDSLQSFE